MKKSIFSITVYILVLYLIISLISCNKENPITPPPPPPSGYQFDSARYEWRCDTIIWNLFYPPFVADTSNLFYRDMYGRFIHFDGIIYHYFIPTNINPLSLGGFDKNNVYIGGNLRIGNSNDYILKIQKWTGSGFKEMPTVDTSHNTYNSVGNIYCRNLNEIWLGTAKGSLYKYDGIESYQKYLIDTNYEFDFLTNFYETINNFYVFGYRFSNPYTIDTLKIFLYENDKWDVVYQKKIIDQTEEIFNYQVISGHLYALHRDGLFEFTGTDFSKVLNIDAFICAYGLQGLSLNEFGVEGHDPTFYSNHNFYHWNGTKWSLEINKIASGGLYISKISDRYVALCNDNSLSTFIYYGKPKNYFKK